MYTTLVNVIMIMVSRVFSCSKSDKPRRSAAPHEETVLRCWIRRAFADDQTFDKDRILTSPVLISSRAKSINAGGKSFGPRLSHNNAFWCANAKHAVWCTLTMLWMVLENQTSLGKHRAFALLVTVTGELTENRYFLRKIISHFSIKIIRYQWYPIMVRLNILLEVR